MTLLWNCIYKINQVKLQNKKTDMTRNSIEYDKF